MNSKFNYNKFLKKKSCAIFLFHGVVDKKNLGIKNPKCKKGYKLWAEIIKNSLKPIVSHNQEFFVIRGGKNPNRGGFVFFLYISAN